MEQFKTLAPWPFPVVTELQRAALDARTRLGHGPKVMSVGTCMSGPNLQPCIVLYEKVRQPNGRTASKTRVINMGPPLPRGAAVVAFFDGLTAEQVEAALAGK